eukprot:scpid35204/ scgid0403/ Mitofusin-2; Transmembrane GTPase MFN2
MSRDLQPEARSMKPTPTHKANIQYHAYCIRQERSVQSDCVWDMSRKDCNTRPRRLPQGRGTSGTRAIFLFKILLCSRAISLCAGLDDSGVPAGDQRRLDMLHYKYVKNRLLESLHRQSQLLQTVVNLLAGNTSTAASCESSEQADTDADMRPISTEALHAFNQGPYGTGHTDTAASAGRSDDAPVGSDTPPRPTRASMSGQRAQRSASLLIVQKLHSRNQEAIGRLDQALRIVLVGHVSHGKSLLVNALLKQQVLPSNVGPISYFSVIVRGTDDEQPHARLPGGVKLPIEELAGYVDTFITADGPDKADTEPGSDKFNMTITLLWPRSSSPVLASQDVEIWDTAGYDYNEDINRVILEQCRQADVTLAVVDSTMGLSLSLANVLRDIDGHASVLIAFTKWDVFASHVSPARLESTREAYTRRAQQLVFNEHRDVVGNASGKIFFIDSMSHWNDIVDHGKLCHSPDSPHTGTTACPSRAMPQGGLSANELSTVGSQGFAALEAALYQVAAGNGIKTKLYISWRVANLLSVEIHSVLETHCQSNAERLSYVRDRLQSYRNDLNTLATRQEIVRRHVDNYLNAVLAWKAASLLSVLGDFRNMEREMMDGVEKEVAAHRYLQTLNKRLLSGELAVADRLMHDLHIHRYLLLEAVPVHLQDAVNVLLRQTNETVQLYLSDCALADFQSSPVVILMYTALRVACVLLVAYVFLIFQPLRRAGSIVAAFALLYAVLVGLNFDVDIERTRYLVWHIEHSLQFVTYRRLASLTDQQRQHLHAELHRQFLLLQERLSSDCDGLAEKASCLLEIQRLCHSAEHETSLLMDYILVMKELVEPW